MSRGRTSRFFSFACYTAILALVTWGALAFGAVYPWAYKPLGIGCAVAGLMAIGAFRSNRPPVGTLALTLVIFTMAVGLQLIPLSRTLLERISPATIRFLTQYDFAYVAGGSSSHALSIAPDKTWLGLLLFVALAIFMLGAARMISRFGAQPLVLGLLWVGAALAVFGIVQEALNLSNRIILVYGFWKPVFEGSRPFGPFINRNHFAGWMLMALPLGLGYIYATIEKLWRSGPPGTSNRISILASSSGGKLLLLVFACSTMFMSILMTRSRSGIVAVGVLALLAGLVVLLRQTTTRARVATATLFVVIVVATAAWAGGETILEKVVRDDSNIASGGGRIPIWRDTLTIVRDFPLAGSGLNTYGRATTVYQTAMKELHFQEAHNDYLQVAAEGGVLLAIPILAVFGVFLRDVRRRFREAPKEGMTYWLRVGAVIGLVSIAVQSLFEFSLQMPGNAALFTILAAIALHQSPNLRDRPASA